MSQERRVYIKTLDIIKVTKVMIISIRTLNLAQLFQLVNKPYEL